MQRLLPALAAVIILAAVGLFAYVHRRQAPEAPQPQVLTDLDPAAVTSLEVVWGGERIEVERANDGSWRVAAPIAWPADQTHVQDLLLAVSHLPVKRLSTRPVIDLGAYGLAPPNLQLKLVTPSRTVALDFGAEAATGAGTYVRKTGDPDVYLVDSQTAQAIDASASDLRDRRPIHFDPVSVSQVRIAYDDAGNHDAYVLSHLTQSWRIAAPYDDLADVAALDDWLWALRRTEARLLVPYDGNAAEFGLDHPAETLEFVVGRGAEAHTERFAIGHVATTAGEGWFVRAGDAPYLFVLDKHSADSWRIDAAAFLKKELFTVYPAETAGLEVDPPGQPHVSLSRQGDAWRSGTNPLAADTVVNWLGALRDLKATARAKSDQPALADPLWRIVWQPAANNLTKREGPVTLRIARTGSGYLATVSDRPGVYALDAAAVQTLAERWQDVMGAAADAGGGR